jgi:hypothetical protein
MTLFNIKKPIFIAVFISFAIPSFSLDKPVMKIVDDSALRTSVKESWLMESPGRVLAKSRTLYNLEGGGRIELRAEAEQNEFIVIFARELTSANGAASGYFPGWAQGSWILNRRVDSGAATRIRVFLRSDPYMYIQFRPFNADRCVMDVVVYDAYVVRSLPLPVTLDRLYTMPLSDVLNLVGDKFPIRYFEPNPADYRDHRTLITNIRKALPTLRFADDGAIDQNERYVYIETGLEQKGQPGLNCSGFTKWLIDGLLRPVTGKTLEIPPLKAPFSDRGSTYTDSWEELRDPFFGLDWIRNLASHAGTTLRSPAFGSLTEIEVRQDPFSQLIIREGRNSVIQSYTGFLENAGYGTEGLLPLLYTLAIDEPGKFYLAAVNTETKVPEPQSNTKRIPIIRQYFHVAALFPYFNENGTFQVAVFESAAETSINAFRSRYPGHYISLVRIPIETTFEPYTSNSVTGMNR